MQLKISDTIHKIPHFMTLYCARRYRDLTLENLLDKSTAAL